MVIDDARIIDPIEISSSPAIIKRPIGKAMIPKEAATFSQLAAPVSEAKLLPPKAQKNRNTATRQVTTRFPACAKEDRMKSSWSGFPSWQSRLEKSGLSGPRIAP